MASVFLIPRAIADAKARRDKATAKTAKLRYWRIDEIATKFAELENNFSLNPQGASLTISDQPFDSERLMKSWRKLQT